MINTTNKNTVLIISLILVIIILAIYFIIIGPKIKTIKNISNSIQQQKFELENKYQKGKNLKKSYDDLNLIKENHQQLLGALIRQDEELEFITALEKTADGKNINQNIFLSPPDPKAKTNKNQPLELQISLEGNFIEVLKALNEIERLDYYIIMDQLDFISEKITVLPSLESEYAGNQTVRANLKGQVYWMPN